MWFWWENWLINMYKHKWLWGNVVTNVKLIRKTWLKSRHTYSRNWKSHFFFITLFCFWPHYEKQSWKKEMKNTEEFFFQFPFCAGVCINLSHLRISCSGGSSLKLKSDLPENINLKTMSLWISSFPNEFELKIHFSKFVYFFRNFSELPVLQSTLINME
jgi:hypothetical protein